MFTCVSKQPELFCLQKHLPTMHCLSVYWSRKKTTFIGPYQFLPSWSTGQTDFTMTSFCLNSVWETWAHFVGCVTETDTNAPSAIQDGGWEVHVCDKLNVMHYYGLNLESCVIDRQIKHVKTLSFVKLL